MVLTTASAPLLVSDFDFELPPELIAQAPRPRGASRLLVLDRAVSGTSEATVRDLPRLLAPGDLLVVNDTRVFPARLLGRRDPSGGAVECLLIAPAGDGCWEALVHPGQKLKPGARMIFEDTHRAPGVQIAGEILERHYFGRRLVRLDVAAPESLALEAAIDAIGHVPLPPYIHRPDTDDDRERYQTIYARARGSVAAPTAGLHFDDALLAALDDAGILRTTITLHVGYGTFEPVRVARVDDHRVAAERYEITGEAAQAIARARASGQRVVAVGTTTARAIESAALADDAQGGVVPGAATTDLCIRPGHRFRVVDALFTNFHLPKSSLLLLVAAFAGRERVLDAYRDAIARDFRFYSYGDAMLVL